MRRPTRRSVGVSGSRKRPVAVTSAAPVRRQRARLPGPAAARRALGSSPAATSAAGPVAELREVRGSTRTTVRPASSKSSSRALSSACCVSARCPAPSYSPEQAGLGVEQVGHAEQVAVRRPDVRRCTCGRGRSALEHPDEPEPRSRAVDRAIGSGQSDAPATRGAPRQPWPRLGVAARQRRGLGPICRPSTSRRTTPPAAGIPCADEVEAGPDRRRARHTPSTSTTSSSSSGDRSARTPDRGPDDAAWRRQARRGPAAARCADPPVRPSRSRAPSRCAAAQPPSAPRGAAARRRRGSVAVGERSDRVALGRVHAAVRRPPQRPAASRQLMPSTLSAPRVSGSVRGRSGSVAMRSDDAARDSRSATGSAADLWTAQHRRAGVDPTGGDVARPTRVGRVCTRRAADWCVGVQWILRRARREPGEGAGGPR